jgi:hypothetical protein
MRSIRRSAAAALLLSGCAAAGIAVDGRAPAARRSAAHDPRSASRSAPARAVPRAYGVDTYTVTVIPATSFTSDDHYVTDYGSLARYFPFDDNHHHYFAGLSQIPSGAVIDKIGLECASTGNAELTATIFYIDQTSGTTSGIVVLPNTPHDFDTDYSADFLGFQLVRNVHNALVIDVDQAPNTEPLFGWVEVWWRRTVSSPPDQPTFNDVPATDTGFPWIEALAASQITGGCGNGNFCPDAPLTRRQMAVFLSKALGLHWPD